MTNEILHTLAHLDEWAEPTKVRFLENKKPGKMVYFDEILKLSSLIFDEFLYKFYKTQSAYNY